MPKMTHSTLSPSSTPFHEPLWTIEQAATYLGVSARYLRDTDCPRLRLPGHGPKGQPIIRFLAAAVRAWAERWRTDADAYGSSSEVA